MKNIMKILFEKHEEEINLTKDDQERILKEKKIV